MLRVKFCWLNYGFTVASTILPNILQEALFDVWTLEDCEERYGEETINDDGHICVGEENQSGGCFVSQCFYARHHQYNSFTPQIYGPYNFGAPFAGVQRTRVEDLNFSSKIMNCIERIFPRIDIVGVDISFWTHNCRVTVVAPLSVWRATLGFRLALRPL